MDKKRSAYELLFIADVACESAETEATVRKFVSLVEANGEIIDKVEWGKRRLEYPINDKKEGYYTVVTFRADPEFPAELERLLNIDEKVMRLIIVKLDEETAEKVARRAADRAAAQPEETEPEETEETPAEAAEESAAPEAAAEEPEAESVPEKTEEAAADSAE